MTLPTVRAVPSGPVPTDTPTVFASKAAEFVPSMSGFGEDINAFSAALESYALNKIDDITATLSASNYGTYDALIIGDTDGVNTDFDVAGIGFYPSWSLYVDGKKWPNNNLVINGKSVTLATAPASGVVIEATGPRDYRSIPPDGYKTIWLTSDLNGTISISCTSSNNKSSIWRIAGQPDTESINFSYNNDGSIVSIYCFIPDDLVNGFFNAFSCGINSLNVDYNVSNIIRFNVYNNNITNASSCVGFSGLVNIKGAWRNNNLTSFPLLDSSNVTSFESAWRNNNLTSFPLIDSSSVNSFEYAWDGNNLTSFPLLDSSNVTTFRLAWRNNNLTSFPLIDSSNVNSFYDAWDGNNLTSFPLIDSSNVTSFRSAWRGNNLNSFPDLSYVSGTVFTDAWLGNNLDVYSVNLILSGLDRDGVSNASIGLNGGSNATPTGSGLIAKASLESRGCTVKVN